MIHTGAAAAVPAVRVVTKDSMRVKRISAEVQVQASVEQASHLHESTGLLKAAACDLQTLCFSIEINFLACSLLNVCDFHRCGAY